MTIRTRTPLRISFAGGGTDVPPYCDERGGAVLCAGINRFAYASLDSTAREIVVKSLDYDAQIECDLDGEFVYDGQLDLAKHVIDHYRRTQTIRGGLDIHLHNDAPPGSGLGSSSAITVALAAALAQHSRMPLDPYQLADLAYRLERVDAGISGGKQDQYATAFGGFNFIEFTRDSTVVHPLRVRPETIAELEYSLVLGYIGGSHFSAHIIDQQVENYRRGSESAVAAMDELKALAYEMKKALLLGKLGTFGSLLDDAWQSKKRMAEGISTPAIDEIYDEARKAGALGGKIPGAGGGGFMFFFCRDGRLFAVQEVLLKMGVQLAAFSFVPDGVMTWEA